MIRTAEIVYNAMEKGMDYMPRSAKKVALTLGGLALLTLAACGGKQQIRGDDVPPPPPSVNPIPDMDQYNPAKEVEEANKKDEKDPQNPEKGNSEKTIETVVGTGR